MRPDDPWGEREDGDDEAETDRLEAEILRADGPIEERHPGSDPEAEVSVLADDLFDAEGELIGEAVDGADAFASPEEAAMSIRDAAPGATDRDDPHDVDVDRDDEQRDEP
jgi:hypothetical protein